MKIERLIEIVKDASKLMIDADFVVTQKEGCENIVTSSDVAVQDFLCAHLAEEMPESGFICEEEDIRDVKHECVWIIDPIDGTANYARGIAQCAICVGLKQGENMQMSVVYLPRTGQLFHALRGQGAYLNGKRISVSDRPFKNSLLSTALPVYHKEYTEVCSDIITTAFRQINDVRRFGAAAPELCYLAMGRTELYFEYVLSAWDFAAASLIVEEAGGCLSDLEGMPLDVTRPSGVLAANNRANLDKIVEIVREKRSKYGLN